MPSLFSDTYTSDIEPNNNHSRNTSTSAPDYQSTKLVMDSDEKIIVADSHNSPPPPDVLNNAVPKLETSTAAHKSTGAKSELPVLQHTSGPPAKKPHLSTERVGFTQPPNHNHADIRNDLEDFGFNKGEIKDMLSMKEAHWDPATPSHLLVEERATQTPRGKRERRKSNEVATYEPLYLIEGSSECRRTNHHDMVKLRVATNHGANRLGPLQPNPRFPAAVWRSAHHHRTICHLRSRQRSDPGIQH